MTFQYDSDMKFSQQQREDVKSSQMWWHSHPWSQLLWRLKWEGRLSLGGGGCGELRLRHCLHPWLQSETLFKKKKKRQPDREDTPCRAPPGESQLPHPTCTEHPQKGHSPPIPPAQSTPRKVTAPPSHLHRAPPGRSQLPHRTCTEHPQKGHSPPIPPAQSTPRKVTTPPSHLHRAPPGRSQPPHPTCTEHPQEGHSPPIPPAQSTPRKVTAPPSHLHRAPPGRSQPPHPTCTEHPQEGHSPPIPPAQSTPRKVTAPPSHLHRAPPGRSQPPHPTCTEHPQEGHSPPIPPAQSTPRKVTAPPSHLHRAPPERSQPPHPTCTEHPQEGHSPPSHLHRARCCCHLPRKLTSSLSAASERPWLDAGAGSGLQLPKASSTVAPAAPGQGHAPAAGKGSWRGRSQLCAEEGTVLWNLPLASGVLGCCQPQRAGKVDVV
ncbi:uncharacterized protein LOC126943841 isoform X18 [Macaca thibetana thibetana]|uniref:uncharacterized protein LOC126943841 isoform X18 n=1 Tax=Macaca thibetana thibetana TaxID=257877 RepID=UPI0021BC8622|nr:uncharacterized protein LOC126943841 isoform X18 [Macaca thibetana thibetana]